MAACGSGGFGLGYKDLTLTAKQRAVVQWLRKKWVFEGMVLPVIADLVGLPSLPACLPGEIYKDANFYDAICDIVENVSSANVDDQLVLTS